MTVYETQPIISSFYHSVQLLKTLLFIAKRIISHRLCVKRQEVLRHLKSQTAVMTSCFFTSVNSKITFTSLVKSKCKILIR